MLRLALYIASSGDANWFRNWQSPAAADTLADDAKRKRKLGDAYFEINLPTPHRAHRELAPVQYPAAESTSFRKHPEETLKKIQECHKAATERLLQGLATRVLRPIP